MAQEYEEEHSKDEILEKYLNTATYGTTDGRSAVGVGAAAEVFFDKSVKDLGLKEVALLAGLPQAPTDYNPFLNPDGATERRNQVLNAMANQGYITQEKADEVKEQDLGLQRGYRFEQREQQYFFDYVQDELIARYGLRTVREGGLRIYTTLDPSLQDAAETAIAAHPTSTADNALVSTDTHTGEILAMASTSELRHEPVQPGRRRHPPARLVVQAVRADDGGRPGHGPGFDLLPGAVDDHAQPGSLHDRGP